MLLVILLYLFGVMLYVSLWFVNSLLLRGVWVPQAEALFDNCVVDNDAKSYSDCTPMVLLSMQGIIRSRNTHRLVKTGLSRPQNYSHSPVCQLMA